MLVLARQHLVLRENGMLVGRLHQQATTDSFTGLANRRVLNRRIEQALGDEAAHGIEAALLLVGDRRGLEAVAQRIVQAFAEPASVDGHALPLRVSIGTAVMDAEVGTAAELLKRADIALYAAKRAGKARVVHFRADLQDYDSDEIELVDALGRAVADARPGVAFQPLFDVDGELLGFEALARWTHDGRPIPPARFLAIAERIGLLPSIDRQVLQQAVAALAAWREPQLQVAVNLSAATLAAPDFSGEVAASLSAHGLAGDRLIVEVLERDALDSAALVGLQALRDLGARVAVDDFGVGLAALSRPEGFEAATARVDGQRSAAGAGGVVVPLQRAREQTAGKR